MTGEEVGLGGVMLRQAARGTVRLGREVCVRIPGLPTAAAEEGVAGHQEKEGETDGKTASEEARRRARRRAGRRARSPSRFQLGGEKPSVAGEACKFTSLVLLSKHFQSGSFVVNIVTEDVCLTLMISKKKKNNFLE